MKSAISKLEVETVQQRQTNANLQQHLDSLRQLLVTGEISKLIHFYSLWFLLRESISTNAAKLTWTIWQIGKVM